MPPDPIDDEIRRSAEAAGFDGVDTWWRYAIPKFRAMIQSERTRAEAAERDLADWLAVFGHLGATPEDCGTAVNTAAEARDAEIQRLRAKLAESDAACAELRKGMPLGNGPWVLAAAVEAETKKLRAVEREYADWRNASILEGIKKDAKITDLRSLQATTKGFLDASLEEIATLRARVAEYSAAIAEQQTMRSHTYAPSEVDAAFEALNDASDRVTAAWDRLMLAAKEPE